MSLRNYLFALMGCLIVVLTTTQIGLVYWVEQNIAQEVNSKARHLSKEVLHRVIEGIDNNEQQFVIKHNIYTKELGKPIEKDIEINATSPEKLEYTIITDDMKKHLQIEVDTTKHKATNGAEGTSEQVNAIDKEQLKIELMSMVDIIHDEKIEMLEKHHATKIYVKNATTESVKPQQIWLEQKTEINRTKDLIRSIQIVIILSAIVALIFAYWISIQFNKPLKQLAIGFQHLAKGDYQHSVPEQGVDEIQTTIVHFNHMVNKLDQLTKAEQQNKELSHLAELGEVSRGLAHALRNPIHTIGLSIEQLSQAELDKSQREALLKTIQNKIIHIDKNIKALLLLTSNGINRNEPVPLLAVIQDIMLEYKSYSGDTKVTGQQQKFEVYVDSNIELMGAESEIRSILHTLIINACEANQAQENAERVVINASVINNKHIECKIEDFGQGLDKKITEQLFQPHISTKPEGAGMGLYIAKRIISLHYDGDIQLIDKANSDGCIALATFSTNRIIN